MRSHIGRSIAIAFALFVSGCSITIQKPANGSTVAMPQDILVTEQGSICYEDVYLDNFNMSRVNGSHWQFVPTGKLWYVDPGQHTLSVGARDCKFSTNVSQSSNFTVSKCPLCYACPVGQVHPALGQCCDGGNCDSYVFSNFGPNFYTDQYCFKETAPGSGQWYYELDCIAPNASPIRGGTAPMMHAVSFSATRTGALAQIQVPIGWVSGTNGVQLWITDDAAGRPGTTVLETIAKSNLRPQPQPNSVDAPVHIFSATHPTLTAGNKYWLVIGPQAADTVVYWNHGLLLLDASIPANITYVVNTTNTNPSGPWGLPPGAGAQLRPAFEIDVR